MDDLMGNEEKSLFLSFLLFEICVGCFYPLIMRLRATYVPENLRSTIMNFFRIPLNIFVCILLYNVLLWIWLNMWEDLFCRCLNFHCRWCLAFAQVFYYLRLHANFFYIHCPFNKSEMKCCYRHLWIWWMHTMYVM